MKEIHSNITIIGGGLIGLACAHVFSNFGLSVAILEKNPKSSSNKSKDTRTVAVSEGTRQFLDLLDVWKKIKKFSQPIQSIKVIDRKTSNNLNFDNNRRNSNLGYIVKNKILLDILKKHISEKKNVKIYNDIEILGYENHRSKNYFYTSNFIFKSDLNVAADGKNSSIKNLLKITEFKKNYKRKSLVINFSHTISHKNTAYEFFYKNGPLAILPMQNTSNKFSSSIVWTNTNDYIDALSNFENAKLASVLNDKTENVIGGISKIYSKQSFPISAHINSSFYFQNTIFIGDSAHSFHPIAGQGWNLGMRDLQSLYYLTKKYKSFGIEIGNSLFCKEYNDDTFYRAYRLYQVTDKLDNIFQKDNFLINFLRKSGIRYLEKNKIIKNKISDFAMGF